MFAKIHNGKPKTSKIIEVPLISSHYSSSTRKTVLESLRSTFAATDRT
jgi:hypothetical protein